MSTPPQHTPLDLARDAVCHGLVVEASAGTGKTYSVAALVTRELALRDDLRIGQVLITTFTRNAAAELRDRVRRRLVDTIALLASGADAAGDVIIERLREGTADEVAQRIARLERALAEFDTATISTIHGVCSRVLRAAGLEAAAVVDESASQRVLAEVVNDVVVSHARTTSRWDERRIAPLVAKLLEDPFLEPWIDRNTSSLDDAARSRLDELPALLRECVRRIQAATATQPGYTDLLRIAYELVSDEKRGDLLLALMQRFQLAIVDEAQDTDRLQWAFFKKLFPGGDGRALVSVGDPKQSIYAFRGADVRAYVTYAQGAKAHRTLSTNRRSDQPLLDGLNAGFAGQTFGEGIRYIDVKAPQSRQASQITGSASIAFVDLGEATNQKALTKPVLGQVIALLDDARLDDADGPLKGPAGTKQRRVEPRDIAVLVLSGNVGQLIQRELAEAGIPAVTGGTSSVMSSSMAEQIRSLLDAIEQPSNTGRVRRAAATVFFGHSLADVGSLTDEVLGGVQDVLYRRASLMTAKGLAALAAVIEADSEIVQRIAAGRQGERNITDFLHIFEVMDAAGPRRGCSPEEALTIFARLAAMDDNHELVSRRVESDADAVKILTVHGSKGLQFPCVIVADLWQLKGRGGGGRPVVFYDENGTRKLDLSFALGQASAHAKSRQQAADADEVKRLLYVAATRAEHALTLLVARDTPKKKAPPTPSVLETTLPVPAGMSLVAPGSRRQRKKTRANAQAMLPALEVAPAPAVRSSFRRVSFSSLVALRGRSSQPFDAADTPGHDEPAATTAAPDLELPVPAAAARDVIDFPAGKAMGSLIHTIFERIDASHRPLREEVQRVVNEQVTSRGQRSWKEPLVEVLCRSLETPLGKPLGDISLADISAADRLLELDFSCGLPSLAEGLRARQLGELLQATLTTDDPLRPYADTLASPAFDMPIGGLLTGSIDAVFRLPGSPPAAPKLLVCDYKSNKLHRSGMAAPLAAYAPEVLPAAMAEHHYPLQALLYGSALFRLLRWRLPEADPDDCVAGVLYAFIRGMQGRDTPADEAGCRSGVFFWKPPRGLWQQLSDLLAGASLQGAGR